VPAGQNNKVLVLVITKKVLRIFSDFLLAIEYFDNG